MIEARKSELRSTINKLCLYVYVVKLIIMSELCN